MALNRKDTPWCFLATHAGAGLYDLAAEGAERTGEWRDGIGRMAEVSGIEEPLATYLRVLREMPERHYPGSPLIAQALARAGDRLVLCEKVEEVAVTLKGALHGDARAHIHRRNGYEAHALLPPPEKRGLVLVDPPFERVDEFDAVGDFLAAALARFAGGIYAVWYPLKNRHAGGRFVRRVVRECGRPATEFRFDTGAKGEGQMRSCGVLVVNPPFRFAEEVAPSLQRIGSLLAQGPRAAEEKESYGGE